VGCRVIIGNQEVRTGTAVAVLYCSTMGLAFGPTMHGNDARDAKEEGGPPFTAETEAHLFITWLDRDAREVELEELMRLYGEFIKWYQRLPRDLDVLPLLHDKAQVQRLKGIWTQ